MSTLTTQLTAWGSTLCFILFFCFPSLSAQSAPVVFDTPGDVAYEVPANGNYRIIIRGGDGGDGQNNGSLKPGGAGATLNTVLTLEAGTDLLLVVGEAGETGIATPNSGDGGGGGGGGSALISQAGGSSTLLLVAGGGGGGFRESSVGGQGGQSADGSPQGGSSNPEIGGTGGGGGGFNGAGFSQLGAGGGGGAGTLIGGGNGGIDSNMSGTTADGGFGFGGGGAGNPSDGSAGGGGGYQGGDAGVANSDFQGGRSFAAVTTCQTVMRTDGLDGGGTKRNGSISIERVTVPGSEPQAFNASENEVYCTLADAINSLPLDTSVEEPETLVLFEGMVYGDINLSGRRVIVRISSLSTVPGSAVVNQ